jgi:hypothetical protein
MDSPETDFDHLTPEEMKAKLIEVAKFIMQSVATKKQESESLREFYQRKSAITKQVKDVLFISRAKPKQRPERKKEIVKAAKEAVEKHARENHKLKKEKLSVEEKLTKAQERLAKKKPEPVVVETRKQLRSGAKFMEAKNQVRDIFTPCEQYKTLDEFCLFATENEIMNLIMN